ncbi:hypothetical protein [Nissabacter sp. SGAir0207]|uniref:hypothetical protein n=1 Tax=Nissabacter sp. SGAir0207 TaxID=2126321 RepID=UPI0010CCF1E5|nr:hypothetical protein [Nissabacter sp. SGAir0207]QCR37268.1 hypothetical protein C1N62_14865 [Nissabacter sp. SGAir0207]
MRKLLVLTALLAASSFTHLAQAADGHTDMYINGLCEEIKADGGKGDDDHYLDQLKVRSGAGVSSSAMNKPEFNDDEAEKVVDAFMDLDDDMRQSAVNDPAKCRAMILSQYNNQG